MCGENNIGIILDESAKLKIHILQLVKFCFHYQNFKKRIILTGTPSLIGLMMCGHKLDF